MTDAWNDGFLGECVKAGAERCALAVPVKEEKGAVTFKSLSNRMESLFNTLLHRPIPAYLPLLGPGIITYEQVISLIYETLYNPYLWPRTATMLAELERGNATLAFEAVNAEFFHNITSPKPRLSSDELGMMVICADSYDAEPKPFKWWLELQANMTKK